MKIYISHSSSYDYINKLYNPLKESSLCNEYDFYFPHDLDKIIDTKPIIESSDLLIAEVSLPTTGQGIELGWASFLNTPIVCIHEKGTKYSSSLSLIADAFIEYDDSYDMVKKISNYLSKRNNKN